MRKLIRWLALVMLLTAAQGWAQQYIADNDGRNWNAWSYDLKTGVVFGMMTAEYAYIDLVRVADEYGNGDVSPNFRKLVYSLLAEGGWKVTTIRVALDTYYSIPANQTMLLWKAYFLCRDIEIWTGDKP